MSEKRYVKLYINGHELIFPKEVGMKLFNALVDGDEVYRRDYDWNTKEHWVEQLDYNTVRLHMITSGEVAVMKIIGANKIQERIEKREREIAETK